MFQRCDPDSAMFLTFTLPSHWHKRVSVGSRLAANRMLGKQLRGWTRAMNARLKRREQPSLAYWWIREDHRSGVPHVHMLAVSEVLAAELEERDRELAGLRPLVAAKMMDASALTRAPESWRDLAVRHGWGTAMDAQIAQSREGLLNYCAKVAAELEDREVFASEVTKTRQAPELLPRHCRSFGYSAGFIPPRSKSADWTGWLEDEHGPMRSKAPNIREADWEEIAAWVESRREHRGRWPVFDPADVAVYLHNPAELRAYLERDWSRPPSRVYQLRSPG